MLFLGAGEGCLGDLGGVDGLGFAGLRLFQGLLGAGQGLLFQAQALFAPRQGAGEFARGGAAFFDHLLLDGLDQAALQPRLRLAPDSVQPSMLATARPLTRS